MLALAHLVAAGRAERPPVQAYLQHPEWRKIWLHLLDQGGLEPSDEFEALQMMKPLEEEFMSRGRSSSRISAEQPVSHQGQEGLELDAGLRRIMEEYGISEEYIRRKYVAYAVSLQAMDQGTGWNNDIDDYAREIGALTEDEIKAAWTDRHQAILNRIKVALVSEGCVRFSEEEDGGKAATTPDGQDPQRPVAADRRIPDPFPEEIEVPGNRAGLKIPSVNLEDARDSEEYERLFKTAVGGAANLLVSEIQERTDGVLALPTARGCALDMVLEAHDRGGIPTEDTRGFFVGGLNRLDAHWSEWGRPIEAIRRLYAEDG